MDNYINPSNVLDGLRPTIEMPEPLLVYVNPCQQRSQKEYYYLHNIPGSVKFWVSK